MKIFNRKFNSQFVTHKHDHLNIQMSIYNYLSFPFYTNLKKKFYTQYKNDNHARESEHLRPVKGKDQEIHWNVRYSVSGTKEPNEWVGGIERTCRASKNMIGNPWACGLAFHRHSYICIDTLYKAAHVQDKFAAC